MPSSDDVIEIEHSLVASLISEQHPDLAERPLQFLSQGWDNVTWRLGDDLVVRLPRRPAAAPLIANEQRWLPAFAPSLPVAVPVPVRRGQPNSEYPWQWSICPWFPGDIAARTAFERPDVQAQRLGEFLAALHTVAPEGLEPNPVRGGHLSTRQAGLDRNLAELAESGVIDAATRGDVQRTFERLLQTPAWGGPPVRLHGDLHSANVLVESGAITAVIDWGDLGSGDPACDLAIGWMLFDAPQRREFHAATGHDNDTIQRAAGWALSFFVVYMANEGLSAQMARIGRDHLPALLTELSP